MKTVLVWNCEAIGQWFAPNHRIAMPHLSAASTAQNQSVRSIASGRLTQTEKDAVLPLQSTRPRLPVWLAWLTLSFPDH